MTAPMMHFRAFAARPSSRRELGRPLDVGDSIDRSPRTADARADTPIECLVLSAAALDRLRDTDPSIAIHILQNLLRGVHRMVRRSNEELAAAMR